MPKCHRLCKEKSKRGATLARGSSVALGGRVARYERSHTPERPQTVGA